MGALPAIAAAVAAVAIVAGGVNFELHQHQPVQVQPSGNTTASNQTQSNTTQPNNSIVPPSNTSSDGIQVQTYSSAQVAAAVIDKLQASIGQVYPSGPPVDLGTGIKANFNGGAGTYVYQWHEGNWTLNVKGVGDSTPGTKLSKSVVAYLHSHMLPAPNTKGTIIISGSSSGATWNTTIAWQEGNTVHQLKQSGDPVNALTTVVNSNSKTSSSSQTPGQQSGTQSGTAGYYKGLQTVQYSSAETQKITQMAKQQGLTAYVPAKMGGPSGYYVPGSVSQGTAHSIKVPFEDMAFYEAPSWQDIQQALSPQSGSVSVLTGGSYTLSGGEHGQWYTLKYSDGARSDIFVLQEGSTWVGIVPNPAKSTIPSLVQAVAQTLKPIS